MTLDFWQREATRAPQASGDRFVYSASFMWEPGDYDAEFHRLNAMIDEAAKANPGFLGSESWQSPNGARRNAVYYWADLESLEAFSSHPVHLEAKRQYDRWYRGYQIVIARVIRSYGDDAFPHVTQEQQDWRGPGE